VFGRDCAADAGSVQKAATEAGGASMTKDEKDAICKVVCAKYQTPGMHSLLCPYTTDRWKIGKFEKVTK
jgi:hypothetical protein